MKSKLRDLLLAAMALTLFAGCSNIALNDAAVEGSDAGDKYVLTVSVDGFSGAGSIIERTIDPGKYTVNTQKTTFEIEGKSAHNKLLERQEILSNGKTTIALDYDVWYLTLYALDDGKKVLKGFTEVDLRKSIPAISFTLSTKGIEEDGSLVLTSTNTLDSSIVKSYTAGLYDIDTNKLIGTLDEQNVESDTEVTFTRNTVPAGDYIFKFTPFNSNGDSLNVWSDVVTIAPNRKTDKTFTISGLMTKPDNPTNFSASRVKASETDNDDYYTVRLSWTDASVNEENFVLRIYELTNVDATWSVATAAELTPVKVFDNDFYGDSVYFVSGTLGASTKTCDVKLPTGKLYDFTLAAKNRAGLSAFVTRDGTPEASDEIAVFANNKRVNRQKITYNLMGGTYPITGGSSSDDVVEYRSNSDGIYTIKTFENLVCDEHPFNRWEDANGNAVTTIPAYEDIVLYAAYNTNATVSYDIEEEYKTLTITAACTGENITYTDSTGLLEIDSPNNNWKSVNMTFTIDGTETYEKIIVQVGGKTVNTVKNPTTNTITCKLNNFKESNSYNVVVIATKNGHNYSGTKTVVVDIKQ